MWLIFACLRLEVVHAGESALSFIVKLTHLLFHHDSVLQR